MAKGKIVFAELRKVIAVHKFCSSGWPHGNLVLAPAGRDIYKQAKCLWIGIKLALNHLESIQLAYMKATEDCRRGIVWCCSRCQGTESGNCDMNYNRCTI